MGQTYIDPGYSANDNYDGNITSTVVENGLVDTSAEGTYFRNYNVTDSSSTRKPTNKRGDCWVSTCNYVERR